MQKTELLAPASNLKSVTAAVNSGCDAIYIGGRLFNARAYADSPDNEQLREIIDLCHLRGVRVFITLNTLYKNSELNELMEFAHYLYTIGADAFIVQDMGFLLLAKKYFPDTEIHCSTQMTVHNAPAAVFFDKMGIERVVLSRELSLDEIRDISARTNCDIECFVHGALCVCYSGRCLMSSIFGGRSGNRGRCAQPCRKEYILLKNGEKRRDGYLLSPKDICTVEFTDKLAKAGIYSFKIEGRMKSPEYVAQTVSSYRKAMDGQRPDNAELTRLRQIFNRGGSFSNGYYNCFAGSDMLSPSPKSSGVRIGKVVSAGKGFCTIKTNTALHCGDGIEIWNSRHENTGCGISAEISAGSTIKLKIYGETGSPVYLSYDKRLADELKKQSEKLTRRMPVKAEFTAVSGEPMRLSLLLDTPVTISGGIPQKAESKPMTKEDILSRLAKTGGTPFEFDFVKTHISDGLFVPVAELNRMRREACEKAEEYITASSRRTAALPHIFLPERKLTKPQKLTVFTEKAELIPALIEYRPYRIYAEVDRDNCGSIISLADKAHEYGVQLYAALPRIMRGEYIKEFSPIINKLDQSGIDGWLVRNYASIDTKKPVMHDYCFNVTNSISAEYFKNINLSPELTAKELKGIAGDGSEIVVYGHLVLMSTHQCPIGNSTGTKKGRFCSERGSGASYALKDKTGAILPVMPHCQSCTAFILNNAPIWLAHRFDEISAVGAEFMRLDFTVESEAEARAAMEAYTDAFNGKKGAAPVFAHTSGHYFRGVQ